MFAKTYVIMPLEWDYDNDHFDMIKYLSNQGIIVPSDIVRLDELCGSMECSKGYAVGTITKLKKEYPYVKFGLFEGATWGSLTIVEEF